MPSAEIITIGTELLLGEIVDTNSAYLARKLRDLGVDVFRTTTVGDNVERIAGVLRETFARAEIVITTGGLGPTVDDPTRAAAALAVGHSLEFRPELWEQIVARMARFGRVPTENQKRQAYIPEGAAAIRNPVGTAPAFIVEHGRSVLICLPGVPREMEHLTEFEVLPYLQQRFDLHGTIKARVLHTAGVGESQIDEWISDLETLSNPTVGLAAHAGQVDIRITAKGETLEQTDALIAVLEQTLRARLGETIYGADAETLEGVTLARLDALGFNLAVVECGLGGALIQRLAASASRRYLGGEALPALPAGTSLTELTRAAAAGRQADCGIGLQLRPGESQQDITVCLVTPRGSEEHVRSYGGHPKLAAQWAVNLGLDMLRRLPWSEA